MVDWWYDNSDDSDVLGTDDLAEWRQEVEAKAEARRQRLAAAGAGWVEQCSLAVRLCEQELRGSPFWGSVQAALQARRDGATADQPVELICYGLGELDSPSARFQLGLLLLLAAELRIQDGSVYTNTPFPSQYRDTCLCEAALTD
jgi:hypothetical protein